MKNLITFLSFACISLLSFGEGDWPTQMHDQMLSSTSNFVSLESNTPFQLTKSFDLEDGLVNKPTYILTGDVTGNGINDVVVSNYNKLLIIYGDGSEKKLIQLPVPSVNRFLLADTDGNGTLDILMGSAYVAAFQVNIYDGFGNHLKTIHTRNGQSWDSAHLHMYPVKYFEDGRLMVLYDSGYSRQPRGFAMIDCNAGAQGEELWFYSFGDRPSAVSYSDIDGDGDKDFIAHMFTPHNGSTGSGIDGTGIATNDGDLWAIVVDEFGNNKYTYKFGADTSGGANGFARFHLVDLDHDGADELIGTVGHYSSYSGMAELRVYDAETFNLKSRIQTGYNRSIYPNIADLYNDGTLYIVGSERDRANTYIYDMNLNIVNQWTQDGFNKAIADLNGDSVKDLIMLTGKNTVYAIDGATFQKTWQWTSPSTANIRDIIPSDIDGDGYFELLVTQDGSVHILESEEIPTNTPPIITGPTELSGTELSEIQANFSISDPDNNLSTYWVEGLPEGANLVDLYDNYIFTWTPSITQAGDYTFTIHAVDDAGATAEHTVTVHVEDLVMSEQYQQIVDYLYTIPGDQFTNKNDLKYLTSALGKVITKYNDEQYVPAFNDLLRLVKFCDAGLLDGSNGVSDKILAGDYQKQVLDYLLKLVKNLTSEMNDYSLGAPPLVLVHGLFSNADSWQTFISNSGLTDGGVVKITKTSPNAPCIIDDSRLNMNITGNNFLVYRIELSDGAGPWDQIGIEFQGEMVEKAMLAIMSHSSNLSAVLVGHSMGGLAVKSYLVNYGGNDLTEGYITIGTPHRGAPLAEICDSGFFAAVPDEVLDLSLCNSIHLDGIHDLQLDSQAIDRLNAKTITTDFQLALGTTFAFRYQPQHFTLDFVLTDWFGLCFDSPKYNFIFDENGIVGDGIVPIWSQLNESCDEQTMKTQIIEGSFHMKQTSNPNVINRILYEYWTQTR
jgi:pimeloyl-ACP methyl ester carboxylesterase